MTRPTPRGAVVQVGDEIRVDGEAFTVLALIDGTARLADATGAPSSVPLTRLLNNPTLGLVVSDARKPTRPTLRSVDELPRQVAAQARWWERHIVEVLTGLVDQATRTAAAVVLRPTTKAVDASLLLARALTPEPMRPGWVDALRMSRSVLPHRNLTSIDQRLNDAAAREYFGARGLRGRAATLRPAPGGRFAACASRRRALSRDQPVTDTT